MTNLPPVHPDPTGGPTHDLAELVRDLLPVSQAVGGAATHSVESLLPQVYDELRGLAASYLRRERPDHTLQPTALVHEVYLRLAGDKPVDWQNRAHFLGIAARIMRRVLADSATARKAQKRGGGAPKLTLDAALDFSDKCIVSVDGVDEALRTLEQMDARQGQIVELRFFGGLTTEEIAEVLGISMATVKREWATAKLWLQRQLGLPGKLKPAATMDPVRWQQVKSVLADALEQEDDAVRGAVVERACQGDQGLRQEVESLLGRQAVGLEQFADGAGALLGQPSGAGANVGRRLGPYELTRELGRGGMGAVYLARRADGRFEQQVAVKLLKRGTDTDEVLRRFHVERRILARLEHPNIARLLDGGETDDGLPFFVMEYVDGVPLTAFARQSGLSIDARLELFDKVCAAVQFAHQNLIVHRDLKPGNILVTAGGEPKLLDFGLAKLVGPVDGDATALEITVVEARRLTPAYASPEQVRGTALTTVSDVYSLGALLYELLTGQPPHRFNGLHPSPVELLRVIGEQEPLRASLAADIRTRPRLRGDLDNIVGLAMRKDPARRYQTVSALADDLRRHLESRPVRARPDTWWYRTAKFVDRNRTGVAVGVLVALALTTAVIVSVWEARRATQQAKHAERRFNDVRTLAHSFLFDFHDAIRDLPGSTPARRLLVTQALDYLQRLTGEAGNDPALRRELALAYVKVGDVQGKPNSPNLGDTQGALASYRRAADIVESLPDDDASASARADTWSAQCDLCTWTGGKPEMALDLGKRALRLREKIAARAPENPAFQRDLATSLISVGDASCAGSMAVWDRVEQARVSRDLFDRARQIFERLRVNHPADLQNVLGLTRAHYRLGNTYHILGMHDHNDPALLQRGLEHHRRSVEFREMMLAMEPNSARARRNLADGLTMKTQVQTMLGDARGALTDCERGIELFAGLVAADPDNFWAKQDLAFAYCCAVSPRHALGDLDGAIAELDHAVAMYEALAGADPTSLMPVEHLVHSLRGRTEICRERGDAKGVKESARRWARYAEQLAAASPKDDAIREDVARARAVLEEVKTR